MKDPFVSIIIPVKEINDYIREAVPKHLALDYSDFEVIILPDRYEGGEDFEGDVRIIPTWPKTGPADKRDMGAEAARGDILAFIDDDAYPREDWLKNAVPYFENEKIAAVCGPGVTPPGDNVFKKVSGWVSASLLGGGNVTHRFIPQEKREVDDYPSMNLLVRKSDYEAIGGYDSHYWPGEDTKLCLDLTHGLGKKIIYDPDVLVYHHRRDIFVPHLRQNGRYGQHRGYFAKALPKTSLRLAYLVPSLFTVFLFLTPLVSLSIASFFPEISSLLITSYWLLVTSYFVLLLLTAVWVYKHERNFQVALLTIPAIFVTHIWYGIKFIQGLLSSDLER